MIIDRFSVTLFCIVFLSQVAISQHKNAIHSNVETVFFIGENEKDYELLVKDYNTMLFAVCNNNMEVAYDHWANLLKDLEDYSIKSNFDLKGMKLWFNVFWAANGTIDHIVFYPKPNSKNLNYELVKTFLTGFVKSYQSPLKHTSGFSHYGSAAFPVFSKSIIGPEK